MMTPDSIEQMGGPLGAGCSAFRSLTIRAALTAVLLLTATAIPAELPPPGTHEYIVSTVYVSLEEESTVADLYDRFLALLAGGKIERGAKLPAIKTFTTETKTSIIFSRSYYIAPNELRGFEISIPKTLLHKERATYSVSTELGVDQIVQKQNIKIIAMKESPTHKLARTGASGSVTGKDRSPSAAGSRRSPES